MPALAVVSDISRFLSVFQEPHAGVIQAARQLLSDERAPLRQKLLADLLGTVSENIAAETRAEDPPWFEEGAGSRQNVSRWSRVKSPPVRPSQEITAPGSRRLVSPSGRLGVPF